MRFRSAMIMAAAFAAAACSGDKTAKKTAADSTTVKKPVMYDVLKRPIGPVTREAKYDYVVKVNGNNQLQTSELMMSPPSFPVKFSTYKNADVQMASMVRDGAATLSLSPIFGAQPDPNAFIQIIFDTTTLPASNAADSTLRALTVGRKISGVSATRADSTSWASDAKLFRFTADGNKLGATVVVGRRGNHTYRVFAQYPESRTAVVRDRLREILTQWRWEDDFTYLIPAAPMAVANDSTAGPPPTAPAPASSAPANKQPVKK